MTLRGGVLERYRVHEDGSATLVDRAPSLGRRWGFLALALGALLFIGGGLAAEALDDSRLGAVVVAGFALWVAGIVVGGRSQDLHARAHKAYGGKGEWQYPTNLRGWTPRTAAQLAAVEQIADEHEGTAFVSDLGGRTVDVLGVRKGRVERYWVDAEGRAELVESHRERRLQRRLKRSADGQRWIEIRTSEPEGD